MTPRLLVSPHDLVQQGSVFDHSSGGLYLVLPGFAVAGVSGLFGPRRAAG